MPWVKRQTASTNKSRLTGFPEARDIRSCSWRASSTLWTAALAFSISARAKALSSSTSFLASSEACQHIKKETQLFHAYQEFYVGKKTKTNQQKKEKQNPYNNALSRIAGEGTGWIPPSKDKIKCHGCDIMNREVLKKQKLLGNVWKLNRWRPPWNLEHFLQGNLCSLL